jgi:hypothetical protein
LRFCSPLLFNTSVRLSLGYISTFTLTPLIRILSAWIGLILPPNPAGKEHQKQNIIRRLQTPGRNKRNPKVTMASEKPSDPRASTLAQRLENIDYTHDRRALAWEYDNGQECGARGLVHAIQDRARYEETDGGWESRGSGEECEEDGAGEVGGDHCLDEADAFCEGGSEDVADC